MSTLGALFGIQIVLGALDNLCHHEWQAALPGKREARLEVALHAGRELCYAALFAGLAWFQWHGAWATAVVALLAIEIVVTLIDFVVEDDTRRLPRTERVLHTVLAINFGGCSRYSRRRCSRGLACRRVSRTSTTGSGRGC